MVLAISFFVSVFSSLLWLIYSTGYISDNTVGVKFSSLGLTDLSVYILLVIMPIFVLWMVFGYVNQYINLRAVNKNMYSLFKQMKKNQDYSDLLARILLESEQQIKNGFILNRLDILIADINELLATLISRTNIASAEQIENLWGKVKNGSKWAFGKVIIEVNQNQADFGGRVFNKAQNDVVLAGTVLEFCARYQNILSLLEKHDQEKIFLMVVETGVLGKVYSILAPIADDIQRYRGTEGVVSGKEEPAVSPFAERPRETPAVSAPGAAAEPREDSNYLYGNPYPQPLSALSAAKAGGRHLKEMISEKFSFFKKKEERSDEDFYEKKDPFSMALERSFGSEENVPSSDEGPIAVFDTEEERESMPEPSVFAPEEKERASEIFAAKDFATDEPRFDIQPGRQTEEPRPAPVVEPIPLSNTQKALDNLKKEWAEMRRQEQQKRREAFSQPEEKVQKANEEEFVYPFGGWTDAENYNK